MTTASRRSTSPTSTRPRRREASLRHGRHGCRWSHEERGVPTQDGPAGRFDAGPGREGEIGLTDLLLDFAETEPGPPCDRCGGRDDLGNWTFADGRTLCSDCF